MKLHTSRERGRLGERLTGESGVTLIEVLVSAAIMGVLFALALALTRNMTEQSANDGAVTAAVGTLQMARSRAIGERRNIQVSFTEPSQIQVRRIEINGDVTPILTQRLENGFEFVKFGDMGDTPDEFGDSEAVAFPSATGDPPDVRFTSEGTLVNTNGDVLNGTIFIGKPNDPHSARAITIFGVSGLLRTWRRSGTEWLE